MSVIETVRVYFDYLCPYAWRGAELAARVAKPLSLQFTWRHFSLWQSNYQPAEGDDPDKKLWQQPLDAAVLAGEDRGGWGLLPFLVSIAGKAQDASKEDALRLTMFRSYHYDDEPFCEEVLLACAASVGLDAKALKEDLDNPVHRKTLAQEYAEAKRHHVFGTPTFHFAGDHLAYFRVQELPEDDDAALKLFQDYRALLENYPFLETVKRPRAPK